MTRKNRDAILRSYYGCRDTYEKLAQEMLRLFDGDIDPSVPTQSIYTIKHRIKDVDRLLDKLVQKEKKSVVDASNYQRKVDDILGLRIVCLRLSDVEKIEKYVSFLSKEDKLLFVKGPVKKQTFVLPVNPGEGLPKDIDLQYSGYSSIHYVVRLGKALRPTKELKALVAELQVRTLLEEAWGEIDHKYRYEIVRRDIRLPDYVTRGFYNFSAYLQAAALQAEYLCNDVETILTPKKPPRRHPKRPKPPRTPAPLTSPTGPTAVSPISAAPPDMDTVEGILQAKIGFPPTERLAAYVKSRLWDYHFLPEERNSALDETVLNESSVATFRELYREIAGRAPFQNQSDRDIDVINVVNFGLLSMHQPVAFAKEGLRAVLKKRFSAHASSTLH